MTRIRRLLLLFPTLICLTAHGLAAADSNSPNTNKTDRWQLAGYVESDASVAKHPSYRKLKTVAVGFASPELMSSLKSQFPSVSFVPLSELSANANDDIKLAATAVIGHHDDEGIARFLRERFSLDTP